MIVRAAGGASQDEDAELVRQTLAGDREAFGRLYSRYERRLFNTSYRVTQGFEDAGDAVHTAVIKAYQNLASYDTSRPFFPWIVKIVINESLRLVDGREVTGEDHDPGDDPAPGPEDRARATEIAAHLDAAVAELTPEYRAVIALRHVGGLSYAEMGEALDTAEKTVRSRLFTARRRLRELLEQRGCTP